MTNHRDFNAAEQNQPPRVAGTDPAFQVFSGVTGAAAVSLDLWAGYAADAGGLKTPQGKCWIELEATATPAYVRFSRTASTGTTVNNGVVINIGATRKFYLDPTKDLFLDVISTGAGTIKWRMVGPILDRSRM